MKCWCDVKVVSNLAQIRPEGGSKKVASRGIPIESPVITGVNQNNAIWNHPNPTVPQSTDELKFPFGGCESEGSAFMKPKF